MGNPAGFVLSIEDKHLYHAGDTAYFSDMSLISEDFDLDIAFLPIGDNFTMGIKDAVKASKLLKAHLNIPIHFNTFPVINQNPKEFVELLKNDTGKVMSVGSSFEI
jgi:L-ascorbate metabolism protein UlaG (beta-lactamase superfamily)